jgi:hypothetical protein
VKKDTLTEADINDISFQNRKTASEEASDSIQPSKEDADKLTDSEELANDMSKPEDDIKALEANQLHLDFKENTHLSNSVTCPSDTAASSQLTLLSSTNEERKEEDETITNCNADQIDPETSKIIKDSDKIEKENVISSSEVQEFTSGKQQSEIVTHEEYISSKTDLRVSEEETSSSSHMPELQSPINSNNDRNEVKESTPGDLNDKVKGVVSDETPAKIEIDETASTQDKDTPSEGLETTVEEPQINDVITDCDHGGENLLVEKNINEARLGVPEKQEVIPLFPTEGKTNPFGTLEKTNEKLQTEDNTSGGENCVQSSVLESCEETRVDLPEKEEKEQILPTGDKSSISDPLEKTNEDGKVDDDISDDNNCDQNSSFEKIDEVSVDLPGKKGEGQISSTEGKSTLSGPLTKTGVESQTEGNVDGSQNCNQNLVVERIDEAHGNIPDKELEEQQQSDLDIAPIPISDQQHNIIGKSKQEETLSETSKDPPLLCDNNESRPLSPVMSTEKSEPDHSVILTQANPNANALDPKLISNLEDSESNDDLNEQKAHNSGKTSEQFSLSNSEISQIGSHVVASIQKDDLTSETTSLDNKTSIEMASESSEKPIHQQKDISNRQHGNQLVMSLPSQSEEAISKNSVSTGGASLEPEILEAPKDDTLLKSEGDSDKKGSKDDILDKNDLVENSPANIEKEKVVVDETITMPHVISPPFNSSEAISLEINTDSNVELSEGDFSSKERLNEGALEPEISETKGNKSPSTTTCDHVYKDFG